MNAGIHAGRAQPDPSLYLGVPRTWARRQLSNKVLGRIWSVHQRSAHRVNDAAKGLEAREAQLRTAVCT